MNILYFIKYDSFVSYLFWRSTSEENQRAFIDRVKYMAEEMQ